MLPKILFVALATLACLTCSPALADHGCRGGACGLRRVARAPLAVVKARPARRLLGRIFGR